MSRCNCQECPCTASVCAPGEVCEACACGLHRQRPTRARLATTILALLVSGCDLIAQTNGQVQHGTSTPIQFTLLRDDVTAVQVLIDLPENWTITDCDQQAGQTGQAFSFVRVTGSTQSLPTVLTTCTLNVPDTAEPGSWSIPIEAVGMMFTVDEDGFAHVSAVELSTAGIGLEVQ